MAYRIKGENNKTQLNEYRNFNLKGNVILILSIIPEKKRNSYTANQIIDNLNEYNSKRTYIKIFINIKLFSIN